MAQVNIQKLQEGGSVKKYGTFTKDGVTYQVDDDFLQAMAAHGSSITDDRARADYGAIVNALRSGADLSYDSNTNELRGDVTFDNMNARQRRRAAKRTSKTGEVLDSTFNGRVNQVKTATNALRGFSHNQNTVRANPNRSIDISRKLLLPYLRDENGKLKLDENGNRIYNADIDDSKIFNRLDFIQNLANEENIVDWKGYNNQTKEDYLRFAREYSDWDGLRQRIKNGTITDRDITTLSKLGILDRETTSGTSESGGAQSEQEKWELWDKENNFTPDFRSTYNISYGPNGELLTEGLGLEGYGKDWRHAYFGENFVKIHPELKRFQDYILYNGRLYSKNEWSNPDSEINQILKSPNVDIFNKMSQNLFDPIKNGQWQVLWTNNPFQRYNSQLQYNPYFNSTYKDDNNVLYAYTSPLYENLPQGVTVMDIIDSNTPRNEFGVPTSISPVGLDENGNVIDISKYIRAVGYNGEATGNAFYSRVNPTDKILGGYVWDDFDESGKYSFAYNPDNPEMGYFYDSENNKLYPFRQEVFRQLLNNDGYLSAEEINQIKHMDWGAFRRWLNRNMGPLGMYEFAGARQPAIPYNRQVPKQQTGGLINWISQDTPKTSPKVKVRDEKKAATTSQIKSGDLTAADKWQLGALAADLGALVAAIPTGGNPVAATLGVGSTATQFISDVKRDGLDWGDIGNAALGLGLDAISFLPGVGIAGKAAKTARIIKRIKPLLTAGFSALGLSAALNSINKEGEWTLDDYRNILMGVQGLIGGKRALDRTVGYKKTGKVADVSEKVTPEKLIDIQKKALDDVVSQHPGKFKEKKWYDAKTGKINYEDALKDEEILANLPKNKLYQEGISRIKAATKNIKSSISDRLTGDKRELRARTEEELPWFLQNRFGRSWMRGAQNREFGNVVERLENRADFRKEFDAPSVRGLNIFERGYRTTGELINGDQAYFNPYWFPNPIPAKPIKIRTAKPRLMLPKTAGSWVQLPNDGGMVYRPQSLYKKGGKILKAQGGSKFFGKSMDNQGVYGSFDAEPVIVSAWETGVITPWQAQKEARQRLMAEKITGIDPKTMFKASSSPQLFLGRNQFKPIENQVPLNVQYNRTQRENAYLDLKNPYRNISTSSLKEEVSKPESSNKTASNNVVSTGSASDGRGSLFNPKNLLDLGSLAGGLISNARQRRELARGIRAAAQGQLRSMPTEIYAPYTDMGLARMYGDRIKDIRQFKTVTSDPNQVMAERLMRDQQADQLANERDTRLSQTISEFNDKDLAARREYANQRTQIADYNKAVLGQMENMLAQNKAAKQFTAWNQIINPFIDQKRDDLVRDQYEDQWAAATRESLVAQQDYQKSIQDLFNSSEAQEAWINEQNTNPSWKSTYGDTAAGRQAFLEKYYSGTIQNLQNNLLAKMQLNNYRNSRSRFTGRLRTIDMPESAIKDYYRMPSFYTTHLDIMKKGGILTKSQRYRNFSEQAMLDKAKDYRKAVQKMDDNLIKLLLKMLS